MTCERTWRDFFWSRRRFRHPLWWLDFRFDIVPVYLCLLSCNSVFQKVIIIIISSVPKILTHVNSILFLIIRQQTWHKFGCNAVHAQIFGTNFMAHCFEIPTSSATSWTVKQRFERMTSRTFATLWSVFDVDGRPECGSSSTEVQPSLKRFHHSYVWVLPMASSLNAIFNISNVSVTDFPIFTQNFTQIRCTWKTLIFLSQENRQTRQTCDHVKKHSTMTKQDRAMRFSQLNSPNSLLESSTCRAPLGRRNGRLFWTFGNFLDSPCIYPNLSWPPKIKCLLKKYVTVTYIHFIHEACQILLPLPISVTVSTSTVSAFIFLTLLIFPFSSLPFHNISSSVPSLALGIQHFLKPFTVISNEMAVIMIHTD